MNQPPMIFGIPIPSSCTEAEYNCWDLRSSRKTSDWSTGQRKKVKKFQRSNSLAAQIIKKNPKL